jgi:hypothetical protein
MPVSIKGEDEGMLNLIPGGEVMLSENSLNTEAADTM